MFQQEGTLCVFALIEFYFLLGWALVELVNDIPKIPRSAHFCFFIDRVYTGTVHPPVFGGITSQPFPSTCFWFPALWPLFTPIGDSGLIPFFFPPRDLVPTAPLFVPLDGAPGFHHKVCFFPICLSLFPLFFPFPPYPVGLFCKERVLETTWPLTKLGGVFHGFFQSPPPPLEFRSPPPLICLPCQDGAFPMVLP